MNKLLPHEQELIGGDVVTANGIASDEVATRILWLVSNHLVKVSVDDTGWRTLHVDPDDGRYWELHYPNSERHGGGPPALTRRSSIEEFGSSTIG